MRRAGRYAAGNAKVRQAGEYYTRAADFRNEPERLSSALKKLHDGES